MKTLFKKLLGCDITLVFIAIMVGLMLVVTVPSFSKLGSLFGHETKAEVQEKLVKANQAVTVAVAANKTQDIAIKDLVTSIKNRDVVQVDNIVKKQEVVKKAIKRQEVKEAGIKEIEFSIIDDDIKDEEVSRVQIDFLWSTFCEYNESSSCPSNEAP